MKLRRHPSRTRWLPLLWLVLAAAARADVSVPAQTETKLTASDGFTQNWFGAAVSLDGDYAIVGAPLNDAAGSNSGAAYVFVRQGSAWIEQAKLVATDAQADDQFGFGVSISGRFALIGAPGDDDAADMAGSAYLFVRRGPTWIEMTKLIASDAEAGANFGNAIALRGNTALVGALNDAFSTGAAYVFVREDSVWSEQAKLVASDAVVLAQFGASVGLDKQIALIGTAGSGAYVFVRRGITWIEQAKPIPAGVKRSDGYGSSVAISGDTALIAAAGDDEGAAESGAAYVVVRSGNNWIEQAKLKPSDPQRLQFFGNSVALSRDTALVGASFDDEGAPDAGAAYVFVRNATSWAQQEKLVPSDAGSFEDFGSSVSLNGDLSLVGAIFDNENGFNAGAAYVFELAP